MRPALGSSPLAEPRRPATRALDGLIGRGLGRRLHRLLATLRSELHGLSDATLTRRFGSHVRRLIADLIVGGHAEHDLCGRLTLTPSGRAFARKTCEARSA